MAKHTRSSKAAAAEFRKRVRGAREAKRWTLAELSGASGLHISALSHFEAGTRRPSFENLRQLCKALEVSADYLLGLISVMA